MPHVVHVNEKLKLQRRALVLQAKVRRLERELNNYKKNVKRNLTVDIYVNGSYKRISSSDIIFLRAAGNYTYLYCRSNGSINRYIISRSLSQVICAYNLTHFIKCHQSYVVNRNFIIGYVKNKGLKIHLAYDFKIPVSRRNKTQVIGMLLGHDKEFD